MLQAVLRQNLPTFSNGTQVAKVSKETELATDRIEPEEAIDRIKKPVSVLGQKGPQLVLTEKLPQTELIQKLLQLAVATVNIKTVFNALIYNKNFPLCKTEILVNLFYKGI